MCKCECNSDSPKTFRIQVVGNYELTAQQCGYYESVNDTKEVTAKDLAKWLRSEYGSGLSWLGEIEFPLTIIVDDKVAFNDHD